MLALVCVPGSARLLAPTPIYSGVIPAAPPPSRPPATVTPGVPRALPRGASVPRRLRSRSLPHVVAQAADVRLSSILTDPPSAPTVAPLDTGLRLPVELPQPDALPGRGMRTDVPLRAPRALVPLYISFGTLQALDYHSTRKALSSGAGREANPLARAIVRSPPALIAAKAAATAGVVVAGEKMWKKNRVGAVVFVAAMNAAMGVVVAHNYSVK